MWCDVVCVMGLQVTIARGTDAAKLPALLVNRLAD
jgi:hypothetical protein